MRLIGVTWDGQAPRSKGFDTISASGLAAIIAPRPRLRRPGRKALLQRALQHQHDLEAIMPCCNVLPALPGTTLARKDVPLMLRANAETLTRALKDLGAHVQFQVTMSCDMAEALAYFADHPFADRTPTTDTMLRAQFNRHVQDLLSPSVIRLQDLPLSEDTLVNLVALLPPENATRFEQAVEAIDALWSDGLRIRQVGPAPASSFGSIALRRTTRAEIQAARRLLDLPPGASQEAIARARRSVLMGAPDDPQAIRDAARRLSMAVAAGCPDEPFPMATIWAEGQTAPRHDRHETAA